MNQPNEGAKKIRLGLAGAGMIATVDYGILPNFGPIANKAEIVAIASPGVEHARKVAADFGIPAVFPSVNAMLQEVDLDAVVNLTPIPWHYETSLAILEAGKHLVTEKPIATTIEEANTLCALAESRKLIVVVAPPNMLFRDLALAKRLVRDGVIEKVAFARVRSSHGGPASYAWPANPAWFYQQGSGPLFDMGCTGSMRSQGYWDLPSESSPIPALQRQPVSSGAARSLARRSRSLRTTTCCSCWTSASQRSQWLTARSMCSRPEARRLRFSVWAE
jgi:hypothetical protein